MKTIVINNVTCNLAPGQSKGNLYQIKCTAFAIIEAARAGSPISLSKAMDLKGRAQSYRPRYEQGFTRFANANPVIFSNGRIGPRGGFGYRLNPIVFEEESE